MLWGWAGGVGVSPEIKQQGLAPLRTHGFGPRPAQANTPPRTPRLRDGGRSPGAPKQSHIRICDNIVILRKMRIFCALGVRGLSHIRICDMGVGVLGVGARGHQFRDVALDASYRDRMVRRSFGLPSRRSSTAIRQRLRRFLARSSSSSPAHASILPVRA